MESWAFALAFTLIFLLSVILIVRGRKDRIRNRMVYNWFDGYRKELNEMKETLNMLVEDLSKRDKETSEKKEKGRTMHGAWKP